MSVIVNLWQLFGSYHWLSDVLKSESVLHGLLGEVLQLRGNFVLCAATEKQTPLQKNEAKIGKNIQKYANSIRKI